MIRYEFLNNTPIATLHQAFLNAFADYQVNMQMPLDQFAFRLRRDGVHTEISAGAFDRDQLVGFCLNGSGTWQGEATVYDAGTGFLPECRGRGMASEMFRFMNPQLKQRGFNQYLLEVLTTNEPAVNLYRRLGFAEARKLAVFRTPTPLCTARTSHEQVRLVEIPNWDLYQTFWSGYPSWQHSIEAAERIADSTAIVEYHNEQRCVGYGIVTKSSGLLIQLAVDETYRRRGVGRLLLEALQNCVTASESIKVNNVDENLKETTAFFEALGFKLVLEQYEMVLNL